MSLKSSPVNPPENTLGPGVGSGEIEEAVKASGYPLQLAVANIFREHFFVQEEWAYVDTDKRAVRSIDLLAGADFWNHWPPQPRVRPSLRLLVECKSSGLPYVFFPTAQPPHVYNFPVIAGLQSGEIVLTSDDDPSTWNHSILDVLGLIDDTFLTSPTCAMTFSRCERAGSKIRLSGSDPYNSLVLPLLKATEHFCAVEAPPPTAYYFDLHGVIPLAVVDAPMIAAGTIENTDLELVPWVRVPRHHGATRDRSHYFGTFALDIVHYAFLSRYLKEHLLPFGERLAAKALRHQQVLAEARGFVPGMGHDSWSDIEGRLSPRSPTNRLIRARTFALRVATLGRWP